MDNNNNNHLTAVCISPDACCCYLRLSISSRLYYPLNAFLLAPQSQLLLITVHNNKLQKNQRVQTVLTYLQVAVTFCAKKTAKLYQSNEAFVITNSSNASDGAQSKKNNANGYQNISRQQR